MPKIIEKELAAKREESDAVDEEKEGLADELAKPADISTELEDDLQSKARLIESNQSESAADDSGDGSQTWNIMVVADLDKKRAEVKEEKWTWRSYVKKGTLSRDGDGTYSVGFTTSDTVTSQLSVKGRGMELSELCLFNDKIYSVDDKTGVVYELNDDQDPIPWVILQNGNGRTQKPFKGEWMTVKGGIMYVGGHGLEHTFTNADGSVVKNSDAMWVKQVTAAGNVTHHDWKSHYEAIHKKLNVPPAGYIVHEAVEWSDKRNKWFLLPRKLSSEKHDKLADQRKATNVLISANSDFSDINVVLVGDVKPNRGFNSFKFIPGTDDNVAIALRSVEEEGQDGQADNMQTYVTIFEVDSGKILLDDQFIENEKYEGLAFV